MSKKCFATITLYALFSVFMLVAAYAFSYLLFDHVIARAVIIVALLIVSAALAIIVEKGSFITVVCDAILWGTAISFLFDHLGSPDPLQVFFVVLVMVAWFTLFCFLTKLSFVKENHRGAMLFWGGAIAVADVVFALCMKNVLGWTALLLLAPFIIFFIALPGEAEDFTEHTHHIAIYTTLPALLIVRLLMFFRVPIGSYEKTDFFPEVDDDYIFIYCPKTDDDDDENSDWSEVM